jgi:hypothetical protein
VPIGSALAAGKAFDFRADVLLLIGGILVILTLFLLPTVFRIPIAPALKTVLLIIAGAFITYGIILTVVSTVPFPFGGKINVPKWGWPGVFKIAIVFDLIAAVLAFFVLRRMKAPVKQGATSTAPPTAVSTQRA